MGSMLHLLGEKCLTIYLGNLFDRFNYDNFPSGSAAFIAIRLFLMVNFIAYKFRLHDNVHFDLFSTLFNFITSLQLFFGSNNYITKAQEKVIVLE